MSDIFVSYASPDREVAFRIVAFLEQNGIDCWVAPRDVPPGVEYGHAIIDGIAQSRALVLILSDQSNESQFVRKEVERAVSKTKPVLPVRIREVTPSGSLEFFISSAQWVDACKSPMEQHLLPLVAAIKGGFEFQPVDAAPDEKNIARFSIVDDSTLKLTRADGEAQDGPIRVRCAAAAK